LRRAPSREAVGAEPHDEADGASDREHPEAPVEEQLRRQLEGVVGREVDERARAQAMRDLHLRERDERQHQHVGDA
jgi:hypothetical protein